MEDSSVIYVALGSNQGNRLSFLQRATDLVFRSIGSILKVSRVYETPAVRFIGNNFYNACLKVETALKPIKSLTTLL